MEAQKIIAIDDETILATMPQTVKVRNHLIRHGSITSQEAWRLYGITRLADVIYKIKHKRYPRMDVDTEMVYGRDRYNKPTQYGKYIFKGFLEEE